MGDITDQCTVFLLSCHLLFRRFLQPLTHILKIPAQISHLIRFIIVNGKIQISFFDIFCGNLKLFNRNHRSPIDPDCHHPGSQCKDQKYRQTNVYHQFLNLRLYTL